MSTKNIDALMDIARAEQMLPGIQSSIAGHVTNHFEPFSDLTNAEAKMVLSAIEKDGLSKLTAASFSTQKPKAQIEVGINETTDVVVGDVKHLGSVYDAEAGDFVKVSTQQRELAEFLHHVLQNNVLDTALILKKMSDEKLYLALGASSFKEYAEKHLPFSLRTANDYLAIGRKFAPYLPELSTESALSAQTKSDDSQGLARLGVKKLLELSKLEDADFSEVVSNKIVILADGTELDLDEVSQSTSKELTEQLARHKEYQQELESELDRTAKERDKAIAEADQATRDAEAGKKYKDLYGSRSTEFEAIKSRLAEAHSRLLDFNQAISQIKDLPGMEYPVLGQELRSIHQLMDASLKVIRENNLEAFVNGTEAGDE